MHLLRLAEKAYLRLQLADAYNISVSEVLYVDNCTIKSLVWEHFVQTVSW